MPAEMEAMAKTLQSSRFDEVREREAFIRRGGMLPAFLPLPDQLEVPADQRKCSAFVDVVTVGLFDAAGLGVFASVDALRNALAQGSKGRVATHAQYSRMLSPGMTEWLDARCPVFVAGKLLYFECSVRQWQLSHKTTGQFAYVSEAPLSEDGEPSARLARVSDISAWSLPSDFAVTLCAGDGTEPKDVQEAMMPIHHVRDDGAVCHTPDDDFGFATKWRQATPEEVAEWQKREWDRELERNSVRLLVATTIQTPRSPVIAVLPAGEPTGQLLDALAAEYFGLTGDEVAGCAARRGCQLETWTPGYTRTGDQRIASLMLLPKEPTAPDA